MLEKMADFFAARVSDYEEHMLRDIACSSRFYPETAALLPLIPGAKVLDLGCGTGLELDAAFRICPNIEVTGIDLCSAMLDILRQKPYAQCLTLIEGSYFDVPFGKNVYDCAVSVESLHHFTREQKLPLYQKLYDALKPGGIYVETDYAAADDAEESFCFAEYAVVASNAAVGKYHYDTPLTKEHTMTLLRQAGFPEASLHAQYENTAIIVAKKAAL